MLITFDGISRLQDPTSSYGIRNGSILVPSATPLPYTLTTTSYQSLLIGLDGKLIYPFFILNDNYALSYLTLTEAENYFQTVLHTSDWDSSSTADKLKTLIAATNIIDRLNFKFVKMFCNQPLQWPRQRYFCHYSSDVSIAIPKAIKQATAEVALVLASGFDIEREIKGSRVLSRQYSSVATTYDRDRPFLHLEMGIPSVTAWSILQPYLRDAGSVELCRVS